MIWNLHSQGLCQHDAIQKARKFGIRYCVFPANMHCDLLHCHRQFITLTFRRTMPTCIVKYWCEIGECEGATVFNTHCCLLKTLSSLASSRFASRKFSFMAESNETLRGSEAYSELAILRTQGHTRFCTRAVAAAPVSDVLKLLASPNLKPSSVSWLQEREPVEQTQKKLMLSWNKQAGAGMTSLEHPEEPQCKFVAVTVIA